MSRRMFAIISLVFVFHSILVCDTTPRRVNRFRPPKPRFEIFKPKGLIVWIPAESGITQFSFHAKLNQRFWDDYEVGRWAQTINRPKDGRFTFVDRKAELKLGDTIHFKTMITHNGVTYRGNHGIYEINRYSGSNAAVGGANNRRLTSSTSTLPPFVYKTNERRTKGIDQDAYEKMGPFDYESREHNSPPLIRTRTIATQTSQEELGHKECDRAQTVVNGRKMCSGTLIFEENFDTRQLNEQEWRIENRFASDPDNEFVVYADFQENIQIRNGKLLVRPTLFEDKFGTGSTNTQFMFASECTGVVNSRDCIRDRKIDFDMIPPILSSQISTYNSFKFIYGKILIRAKLPKGDWIFPQLYLRPSSEFYGRDEYASGLIRVAFTPGGPRLRNQLSGGLILSNAEPLRCSKICTLTRTYNWSENFHQFGLIWSPHGIYMEVDGEIYCHIEPEQGFYNEIVSTKPQIANLWKLSGNPMAPFDKEFYISLGVGIGGHYDFYGFQEKPWKDLSVKAMHSFWNDRGKWYPTWSADSAMQVDYVKVYAI